MPYLARPGGLSRGAERLQRGVERLARPHHRDGLLAVDEVVATQVHRLALDAVELRNDLLFFRAQALGQWLERVRELGVVELVREGLCPVEGEVEVAAA